MQNIKLIRQFLLAVNYYMLLIIYSYNWSLNSLFLYKYMNSKYNQKNLPDWVQSTNHNYEPNPSFEEELDQQIRTKLNRFTEKAQSTKNYLCKFIKTLFAMSLVVIALYLYSLHSHHQSNFESQNTNKQNKFSGFSINNAAQITTADKGEEASTFDTENVFKQDGNTNREKFFDSNVLQKQVQEQSNLDFIIWDESQPSQKAGVKKHEKQLLDNILQLQQKILKIKAQSSQNLKVIQQKTAIQKQLSHRVHTLQTKLNLQHDIKASIYDKNQQIQNLGQSSGSHISTQFIINNQFWVFQKDKPNHYEKLVLQNNRRLCRESNFTVIALTKTNYMDYLSEERGQSLKQTLTTLKQRMGKQNSNLKVHIGTIERRLILLNILYENGGIMADDLFTIVQNFNWIRQITNNIYVNRGNPGYRPQVVGFYSPLTSSVSSKYKKIHRPAMEEVQKFMVLIPAIENYLIAAEKKAEFIEKIIDQIVDILVDRNSVPSDLITKRYTYHNINTSDVYFQYFWLAGQRVLLKKQKQLDHQTQGLVFQNFAVDYFGLNLINCFYGPYKLKVIFRYLQVKKKIQNVARFSLKEYQNSVGPLRYIQFTTIPKELNDFLVRMQDGRPLNNSGISEKGIMKGSFLQTMYFPESNQPFLYQNMEKPNLKKNRPRWNSLNRTIWFYWESGMSNVSIIPAEVYICVQNIRKMALQSDFVIKEINRTNLKQYIDEQTINRIEYTLANGKMERFVQTQSDLYRLVLLYKYGGVYIDAATIAVQNYEWLINIADLQDLYVYNRFGELPEVVMFWNPNFGGYFDWQINPVYQTKSQWRLSYLNGFIAANKGSQFLKDWLDLFLQLYMKPVEEVLQAFDLYNITSFKWTTQKNHYLLGMDVAKATLGKKQNELANLKNSSWQGAMDFYRLWTISSFICLFKIRDYTNYDNNDRYGQHLYLTRYPQSYAQGIIGKINFMIKIIHIQRPGFAGFLKNNSQSFMDVTHSKSIFRKYLYEERLSKFQVVDGKIVVKLD